MSIIVPPATSYPPNVYNFTPQNLKNWRKALANVKTGTANARILCSGDSTTFGVGSGNTGTGLTTGNMKPSSYPAQLAGLLNSAGVNAHANSFIGAGSATAPNNTANDSRITLGTNWLVSGVASLGGFYFRTSGTSGNLSFTPTVNVDTFVIWFLKTNNDGTISFNVNGGAATTVNCNNGGANAVASQIMTATLGANTLNISCSAGGGVHLLGVEAYDSSKTWVDVMNAGISGATSSSAYAGDYVIDTAALAPNLTLLNFGINDWVLGTSVSTYKTAYQNIITQALATGDAIIITPNPTKLTGGGSATLAAQQALITAMVQLAQSNNIPLIDVWSRYTDYNTANGLGLVFNDSAGNNYHPDTLGYADIAKAIANVLLSV